MRCERSNRGTWLGCAGPWDAPEAPPHARGNTSGRSTATQSPTAAVCSSTGEGLPVDCGLVIGIPAFVHQPGPAPPSSTLEPAAPDLATPAATCRAAHGALLLLPNADPDVRCIVLHWFSLYPSHTGLPGRAQTL